jgi:LEA14-like dessication related protein
MIWLVGCGVGTPDVTFAGMEIAAMDFERAEVLVGVEVANPWPMDVVVEAVDWQLAVAGQPFLKGTRQEPLTIGASAPTVVKVPITVAWSDLWAVVTDLRDSDRSEVLAHEGALPVPRPPEISVASLSLVSVDLLAQKASLVAEVDVIPHPSTPLTVQSLQWSVVVDGAAVARGEAHPTGNHLRLPVDLDLSTLGASFVAALATGAPTRVGFTGSASLATAWGSIPLSFAHEVVYGAE